MERKKLTECRDEVVNAIDVVMDNEVNAVISHTVSDYSEQSIWIVVWSEVETCVYDEVADLVTENINP